MPTLDCSHMLATDPKVVSSPVRDALRTTARACSWKQIIEPVEPFLAAVTERLNTQINSFEPDLAPYAEYALSGNGKHLRPALVALTAKAVGKVSDAHV